MGDTLAIPEKVIWQKIYDIRGKKVMLDRDLAAMYGVETRMLKQAVRRNKKRFPEDFMFEMSKVELDIWRSHFVISKEDLKGLRYAPFCFTEQGITMLSCILNSETAINVNLRIIRTFTKMRETLLTHKDLLAEIEEVRKKLGGQDEKIAIIFKYLKQFIKTKDKPRAQIGFRK